MSLNLSPKYIPQQFDTIPLLTFLYFSWVIIFRLPRTSSFLFEPFSEGDISTPSLEQRLPYKRRVTYRLLKRLNVSVSTRCLRSVSSLLGSLHSNYLTERLSESRNLRVSVRPFVNPFLMVWPFFRSGSIYDMLHIYSIFIVLTFSMSVFF